MRFMIMVKATNNTEASVMPSPEAMAEMGRFNAELKKAGVLLDSDGLHPSSKGARVTLSGGAPTVTDGPFAETKELVAGFQVWKCASLQEAIEWAKRSPCLTQDDISQIEIRQIFELEDVAHLMTPEHQERFANRKAKD